MNSNRSGSCHLAKSRLRCSRRSSGLACWPSRRTTTASGRSPQRSSGIAITAASATAGWAISRFSRSTEEIHSPPDLTRSLERSQIRRLPDSSIATTSPVANQPSSVYFSSLAAVIGACHPRPADLELAHRLVVPGDQLAVLAASAGSRRTARPRPGGLPGTRSCSSSGASSRRRGSRHMLPNGDISVIPQAWTIVSP